MTSADSEWLTFPFGVTGTWWDLPQIRYQPSAVSVSWRRMDGENVVWQQLKGRLRCRGAKGRPARQWFSPWRGDGVALLGDPAEEWLSSGGLMEAAAHACTPQWEEPPPLQPLETSPMDFHILPLSGRCRSRHPRCPLWPQSRVTASRLRRQLTLAVRLIRGDFSRET